MLARSSLGRATVAFLTMLVVFAFGAGNAFAQGQVAQIAPGGTATVYDSGSYNLNQTKLTWTITGPGVNVSGVGNSTSPWGVIIPANGGDLVITPPANAPLSTQGASYSYTYSGTSHYTVNDPGGGGNETYFYGGMGSFNVVSAIPAPAPGPAYPWQASVGGVNTANGNKMTVIPITGFATPGGMSINLALTHNSQTPYSNFNGQKWTFSYLDFVVTDPNAPHNVTVYWGDGRIYTFVNSNGTYLPPAGIYDTLTASGSTYLLKTQSQVTYQFSQPGTGTLAAYQFLKTITDQNGNQITVTYAASTNDIVQSVSDSTGRALHFYYSNGLMTSVTDPPTTEYPAGRTWTFGYSGADLQTVTLPTLADGIPRGYTIAYDGNSHHDITSFTDLNGNTARFGYNVSNQNITSDTLASAQDPMGNTTTFSYTPSGVTSQTTAITDPNGNVTKHVYAIQLSSVTDAVGNTGSFVYDTYNTLTSQTDARSQTTGYGISYNKNTTPEQITGTTATDPFGKMTITAYTLTNKVASVTAPAPNNTGNSVITTNMHQTVTNGVDALTQVTDPNGHQSSISYSAISGIANTGKWGLPSKTTDAAGRYTEYGYDPNGYPNFVRHGTQGDTVTSSYNAIGWLESVTDALSHTTGYTYDAWGRVTSVTAADGTVTNTSYDANGNVLRVEDANVNDGTLHGGVAWTTGYFNKALQFDGSTGWVDLGNKQDLNITGPITISALIKPSNISANGYQNIVAHGSGTGNDLALRIENGNYQIESFNAATNTSENVVYPVPAGDLNQWVNLIATFDGATWRLYRDGTLVGSTSGTRGAVSNTADWALGATSHDPNYGTSRFFNGTIDEVRIFNRAVNTSEVSMLNGPSLPSAVSDGMQAYWRLDDGAGTTTVDWCHSVTNAYDADNRLMWTINGHLDWVRYFYDASNTLQGHVINPYQASQLGLLSYKTDGNGNTTDYDYDPDNRPSETIRPDKTTTSVTYDGDGNVLARLDGNGVLTSYTYDADDRLTGTVHTINSTGKPYTDANSHSDDVTFAYFPDGLVASMSDYTDTTSWTYDNAGNTLSIGGTRGTVSYAYNNNNLRSQMSESSSAEGPVTWQYTYDDANRPASVVDPFVSAPYTGTILFGFDTADRLTSKAFPNGSITRIGYDATNEVLDARTTDSNGNTLADSSYTYDPAGNVATRTDNDGTAASFLYDGADQLSVESYLQSSSTYSVGYTYDHNGNRATQNNAGTGTSYAYDAGDKLTSDSNGDTYSYDGNGNWTGLTGNGNTYTFQYDAENRLIHYQPSPTVASAYSYNGMGLRVAEYDSPPNEQHDLINDGASPGSSLLIDHTLTAKTVWEVYVPGLEQRDGLTAGALHIMGVDATGTVRALIDNDSSQLVTDTFSPFAFGITRSRTGSDPFSLAWEGADGYQTDPNQLMLLGSRVYHPFTGRFLTRDPAGAGDNDYEYADNNPLKYTDATGLDPQGVTDHPGPGSDTVNQWYPGDDFDAAYGGLAGSGLVPVYNAIFTADRKTGAVLGYQITGLAYYESLAGAGIGSIYMSLLRALDKLSYKTLQPLIRSSNAAGHEYWFYITMTQKGLKVVEGGQTSETNGGSVYIPSYALSWGHTHPDHIDGDSLYGGSSIDNFSDEDKDTSDSYHIPGYLGAGDTYDVFRYLPNGHPLNGIVSEVDP